nr:MAG TPA: hypothetical protein [Bacteriophage sp.]
MFLKCSHFFWRNYSRSGRIEDKCNILVRSFIILNSLKLNCICSRLFSFPKYIVTHIIFTLGRNISNLYHWFLKSLLELY